MLTRCLAPLLAAAGCAFPGQLNATNGDAPTITLEAIMADADWIAREPESPYWSDDSKSVYYSQKAADIDLQDLWRVDLESGEAKIVLFEERGLADEPSGDYNRDRTRKVYSRHGDLFLRDFASGKTRQLTRTTADESTPRFLANQDRFRFMRDGKVFVREISTGFETQPAELKLQKKPEFKGPDGFLEEQQERVFDSVREKRERAERRREHERAMKAADPTRAPQPWYLGEGLSLDDQDLSPNERWLFVVLSSKSSSDREEELTEFVTKSGLMETREVRHNVGRTNRSAAQFVLLDLEKRDRYDLSLADLPGIQAALAEDAPDDAEPETRGVASWDVRWAPDGSRVACMIRSHDNNDHWIFTVDPSKPAIEPLHHRHDDAWVGFRFNEWGWAQNGASLYYTSEESGYSQLYVWSRDDGSTRALTQGEFEVDSVGLDPTSDTLYFRANVSHPGVHEIYRVSLAGGEMEQLTDLGGRIAYQLSPSGERLLITHSKALEPPDLFVQDATPGAKAKRLTTTSTAEFHSYDWAEPEYVTIPSQAGGVIHARLYEPKTPSAEPRPAVFFVHGAGYLQNAHKGWSEYFREFMFHSLLVQEGYVVVDMDYRASAGYGRDWRTAIYRNMGGPELEDLSDGVEWLVARGGVARERIGVYGGSYGGFLTLMALFKAPELFACGAALRPVTDWAHYNHGYTSNILNTPEEDPEAYLASSPIEFADGLEKPLLICHGVLDSNVLMKDSMRLAQKLIELGKKDWELALFPIEGHGFREPASWYDEYRRIYELFERELKVQD